MAQTRPPTDGEKKVLECLRDGFNDSINRGLDMAMDAGIKPKSFFDCILTTQSQTAIGAIILAVNECGGTVDEKKKEFKASLKSFLEGTMIIAGKRMKELN